MLREQISELKSYLNDKSAPFGVDLLLPQVGGSARKTNYDYTKGKLDQLIDIIIDSGARLFVSAVGVPPQAVVDKLHKVRLFSDIMQETTKADNFNLEQRLIYEHDRTSQTCSEMFRLGSGFDLCPRW